MAQTGAEEAETAGVWPSYMYDARNRGHNPDASGPKQDVEARWVSTPERGSGPAFMTPVVANDTVYTGRMAIRALDTADGSQKWTFEPETQGKFRKLAVKDGTVFVGYGTSGGDSSGTVFALDASNGDVRWEFQPDRDDGSRPFTGLNIAGGRIFAVEDDAGDGKKGILHTLDAATGEEQWSLPVGPGSMSTPRNPAAPAVANGTAYVARGSTGFSAVDVETGEVEWTRDMNAYTKSATPAVSNGLVFTTSVSGTLHALHSDDGSVAWQRTWEEDGLAHFGSPAVLDDTVYAAVNFGGGESAELVALSTEDGSVRWSHETYCFEFAIADGVLYTGDKAATAYDAGDGTELFGYNDTITYSASPVVVSDTLYVSGENSNSESAVAALPAQSEQTQTESDTETETDTQTQTETATETATETPTETETATPNPSEGTETDKDCDL